MRNQFGSQNGCPGCAAPIDPARVFYASPRMASAIWPFQPSPPRIQPLVEH